MQNKINFRFFVSSALINVDFVYKVRSSSSLTLIYYEPKFRLEPRA